MEDCKYAATFYRFSSPGRRLPGGHHSSHRCRLHFDYQIFPGPGRTGNHHRPVQRPRYRQSKGSDVSSREYFQEAKQTRKAAVGDVVKSKATGELIAVICAPILSDSGDFLGLFGMPIKAEALTDLVANKKFGETGYAFMTNKTGMVIAHPQKEFILSLDLTKTEGLEEFGRTLTLGKPGTSSYTQQGVERIAGYAPVAMTGWSVAISQDKDELLSASRAIRNSTLTVTLLSLAVVATAIYFAARAIVMPINKAVAGLKDIAEGEGDLRMRLPITSRDEVGEMSRWFNLFIEKLQHIMSR